MEQILAFLNYSEYVFWFIVVFSLIVFVHEFGHYYIAKINNVDIEKFSVGFGPAIFKYKDKDQTTWQLSLIPLGGYVKFAGEMYPTDDDDENIKKNKKLFLNKSPLQKASIVLAGPVANFILGIIIFILVFVFFGRNFTPPIIGNVASDSPAYESRLQTGDLILEVNKTKVSSFEEIYGILDEQIMDEVTFKIKRNDEVINVITYPEHKLKESIAGTQRKINYLGFFPQVKPVINNVKDNSPAMLSGLKSGDIILKVDGKPTYDIRQVIKIVKSKPNENTLFELKRNEEIIKKNVRPELVQIETDVKVGQIGITFGLERQKLSFFKAVYLSVHSFIDITKKTLKAFAEIVFGKRDHCEMGGPILIAKVSNDVANEDVIAFVTLIAIISFNLGIINLFPLPLLDGGHFFTYLVEYLSGREIKYNIFKYIQIVGVLVVFSLMAFSILNDIYCRVLS